MKLEPPPSGCLFFGVYMVALAHQARANGANASFGGAESRAIPECGMSTRKQTRRAPARHEPPDPLFDGASASGPRLAGARSARLQHLDHYEGRENPGALRFFAVKRIR